MSPANKLERLTQNLSQIDPASAARVRLAKLFDEGTFVEIDAFAMAMGNAGAAVIGYGTVDGSTVFAFAQDSGSASGAVDKVHAQKIKKVYSLATKTGAPVVGIYDSNGASLASPADTLAAYGELLALSNNISGVVPQLSVVLGPCVGSAALIALGADFVIASEAAELSLGVPAEGSSKIAAETGVVHILTKDEDQAIASAKKLLALLPSNNLCEAPAWDYAETAGAQNVLAVAGENPCGSDIAEVVKSIADDASVLELQSEFGKGCYAALATVGGQVVGVAAAFGALAADECAKLARLVSICDAFSIPVITLVNTSGFDSSALGARDAAKLAHVYAEATTAKVSVVAGKAYGGAYIALAGKGANADMTFAWPGAVISPLKPETAVAFLYSDRITADKTREAVEAEYKDNEASPFAYAASGQLDAVINPVDTRAKVISALDMLSGKRVATLPKKHSNMPL